MLAAKTYNERQRSRYMVPHNYDSTDGWPIAYGFVAAHDCCSVCYEGINGDLEDQLDHYCTIEHIAEAFGVNEAKLLRVAGQLQILDALSEG